MTNICKPPHAVSALRLLAFAAFAAGCAAAVAQGGPVEEVPFVTSPDNVTAEMLRIANVGRGDHVIDLGSGDGRIVIVAARRGATGMGVEIVPDLVARSQRNAEAAGVADKVSFHVQDLFKTDLGKASVITMYLLPEVNMLLRPSLLALKPGTRLVSHDWDMGDWKPDRTVVVPVPDKKVGMEKSSKIHFWRVPARVEGLWCGSSLLRGASLQLSQRFQEFDGTLVYRQRSRPLQGTIEGATVKTATDGAGELVLRADGPVLRIVSAHGTLAAAKGMGFRKTDAASCA